MGIKRILLLMSIMAVLLAACSGDDGDATTSETSIDDNDTTVTQPQVDDTTPEVAAVPEDTDMSEDTAMTEGDTEDGLPTLAEVPTETVVEAPPTEAEVAAPAPVADLPEWQTIQLADARTGEIFTLADFAGKTVFVEPMATWCTNCRGQMGRVAQARFDLDPEQHIFIGLSLETNISNDTLASYANRQGFDWTFAVMTPEFLNVISDEFGRAIRSAPNTPHFVIRPDGSYTGLNTGFKSVDEIIEQMRAESEV